MPGFGSKVILRENSPSWIERADFVRQYEKIDALWLPQEDRTFVQVRLYGEKFLTITHQNYIVDVAQDNSQTRRWFKEARVGGRWK